MAEYEFIDVEVPKNCVTELGDYLRVKVGDLAFVRSFATTNATDHDTYTFRIPKYNSRNEEYKVDVRGYATVPGTEELQPVDFTLTATELKERLDAELAETSKEKTKFVAIKLSKKRFCGEPWQTEKMSEAAQSLFAPDGWTYNRSLSQLHEIKEDPGHVMIYLPEKKADGTDYMVRLTKDEKQEDGTWEKKNFDISSLDLSRMYQVERKKFLNQKAKENDFVELIISKKQVVGNKWQGNDGEDRVNILAPDGYTFSRKETQLHEIKDDPDHYKISLPRAFADGTPYTVVLAKSVKQNDGTWDKETKEVTADELVNSYELAKQEFKQRGRAR